MPYYQKNAKALVIPPPPPLLYAHAQFQQGQIDPFPGGYLLVMVLSGAPGKSIEVIQRPYEQGRDKGSPWTKEDMEMINKQLFEAVK